MQGLRVMKKVATAGPIYIDNKFDTSACVRAPMAARNMQGARILDLISQATKIQSENLNHIL